MVGLPCSGKTTFAKELSKRERALLLTPDKWQIALFGDDAEDPLHDGRHSAIEWLMWDLAKEALSIGTSVILDYGFWAKEERDFFRKQAKDLGAEVKIHFMDTPLDEIRFRLEKRNASGESESFVIPFSDIEKWAKAFQAPSKEEME